MVPIIVKEKNHERLESYRALLCMLGYEEQRKEGSQECLQTDKMTG